MPNFSQGVFNIGTDKSIVVIDNSTGLPISLGGRVTDIETTSKMTTITSLPIDNRGYAQHRYAYNGWTGTITVDRSNGDADALQALQEANYHAGGAQKYYTVTETIRNSADGTVDVYQYNYCVISLPSSGAWRKDASVPLRLSFEAQERVQLSA